MTVTILACTASITVVLIAVLAGIVQALQGKHIFQQWTATEAILEAAIAAGDGWSSISPQDMSIVRDAANTGRSVIVAAHRVLLVIMISAVLNLLVRSSVFHSSLCIVPHATGDRFIFQVRPLFFSLFSGRLRLSKQV